jgi:hypothetical protein
LRWRRPRAQLNKQRDAGEEEAAEQAGELKDWREIDK